MISSGSWQARLLPLATVPTLAKPVGQSAAGPAVGGGGGGVVGGGGAGTGAGGKLPSPGDTTRSAPLPQAVNANVAAKVINRDLVVTLDDMALHLRFI